MTLFKVCPATKLVYKIYFMLYIVIDIVKASNIPSKD